MGDRMPLYAPVLMRRLVFPGRERGEKEELYGFRVISATAEIHPPLAAWIFTRIN
jgi:hypothetical protein